MKQVFRFTAIITTSIILLFILVYFSLAKYVAREAKLNTAIKSDVIFVLGARSYINGAYNPCLRARVDQAVSLYKGHFAKKLLLTGGVDREDNVDEAETMQKIAVMEGVPTEDIILEKKATSTYENFSFSQQILQDHNLKSVIIVTEPFHMARAQLIAQKQQYSFTVSPATKSPCWEGNKYFSKYFLKEPLAIIGYRLQSKL